MYTFFYLIKLCHKSADITDLFQNGLQGQVKVSLEESATLMQYEQTFVVQINTLYNKKLY